VILEGVQRGADETVNPVGRGRFDVRGATTLVDGRAGVFVAVVARHDLVAEPGGEILAVLDRRLPEPEGVANLGAVVLDRAARPVILRVVLRRDADLRGHVDDDGAGDLVLGVREPRLVLEELEQEGEAEPCRPRLVAEQLQFGRRQGPVLGQIVGVPPALHDTPRSHRAAAPDGRKVAPSAGGTTSLAVQSIG